MPVVTLDSVSLAFGHVPLLESASLRLEPGERVCLIGRNGTGKSTLLKLLAGEIEPDAGQVWRAAGLRVARLEQDVPVPTGRIVFDEVADGLGGLGELVARYHAAAVHLAEQPGDAALAALGDLQHELEQLDGWRLEQRVETVLSRLRLPADTPLGELSGGWRRRVLLAKALVADPDLLLLDEPTNHLDIEAIRWLEDYLLEFAGALLFVTHDRALLDRLATRIVELDRGVLTSWPGNYGRFLEAKEAALEVEAAQRARFDKHLAQEEAWVRQGIKARRTRNEGRVRALQALREERARRRDRVGRVRMDIDDSGRSGKLVFEAIGVSKSYGGRPVIAGFSQRILRGDRVGLIGPNGAGKTTWLRLLLGEIQPDAGTIRRGARLQIAYYDQQREQLDPDSTVADSVNDGNDRVLVGGENRHVIGYLQDFLFPAERARAPVKALSGGERNRLLLARLFAKPANVLVLDEPTNDLDIETLELLEDLIGAFSGTILLVSHDRVFLDRIVTSTVAFEGGGRVVEYVGGYEDWLRQRTAAAAEDGPAGGTARPEPPVSRRVEAAPRRDRPRRLTYADRRELDALPDTIEALEAERARLEAEAADAGFYKESREHIEAVLGRLAVLGEEIEGAYRRWHELETAAGAQEQR